MKSYTINVKGNLVNLAKEKGYNAYYADNITAIEIKANNKIEAKRIIKRITNAKICYVFE